MEVAGGGGIAGHGPEQAYSATAEEGVEPAQADPNPHLGAGDLDRPSRDSKI